MQAGENRWKLGANAALFVEDVIDRFRKRSMTEELEPDQFVLSRYYKVKHTGNEMWNVDAKGYKNVCSADMKNLAFETEKMRFHFLM